MSYKNGEAFCDTAEAIAAGMALGEVRTLVPSRVLGMVTPAGAQLHQVDIEKYLPAPTRKHGTVTLATAQSFIDWVNRNKTPETIIYAKESDTSFRAIFNGHHANVQPQPTTGDTTGSDFIDGRPGWGDFVSSYGCPLSPEWVRWMAKSQHAKDRKEAMSQSDFMQFLEDNLLDITQPDSAYLMMAVRSFESVSSGGFKSAVRLENGDVKFNYTDETQQVGSYQLPSQFQITVPIFKSGTPYVIDVNLRYRASGGSLSLWYELVRPHKSLEHAFRTVSEQIAAGTSVPMFST